MSPRIVPFEATVQTVREGYDRHTCWVQTRGAFVPPTTAVITTQKLLLAGSDVFFGIHSLHSDDSGLTFADPAPQAGLGRQPYPEDPTRVQCPCDATPAWHAPSGRLLLSGHTAVYRGDALASPYRRRLWCSLYDLSAREWSPMQMVALPEEDCLFSAGGGCTQRLDLPDGDILMPVYGQSRHELETDAPSHHATVVRCRLRGQTLAYVDHGQALACADPRGFCEPSIAALNERYFLTLRNDLRGYVAVSTDGLNYGTPVPWRFDDGADLGNYNTQQHWLTHSDALFLVYTRRGAHNDHVFRHRAPLFMAQVDTDRLCIVRATERVVVPEHGARLGNFGTAAVSPEESWVIVSEWMQTTPPNPYDCTVCERYGSNNRIFISRIRWGRPSRRP